MLEKRPNPNHLDANAEVRSANPVNQESAAVAPSSGRNLKLGLGVAAAALAVLLWMWLGNPSATPRGQVLAADLRISSYASLVDIASGNCLAPIIAGESIYIPVPDNGTFSILADSKKPAQLTQVTGKNVIFSSLSPDGKMAACTDSQGISIFDLETRKSRSLIKGNDYDLYYSDPSWSPDSKRLLITRRQIEWKQHGYEEKSLEIFSINADGSELKKICAGSYASYIADTGSIVLERDGNIMIRKAGIDEAVVDKGRFPSASPDGLYLAYIKTTQDRKSLGNNAWVETDLSDVYICSTGNFADRRKVTANYPNRFMDENEWKQGLDPGAGEQALVFSGVYDFYNPVWGDESDTLYVLKGGSSESIPMRITRIELSPDTLASVDTVSRWLEACINRDDDFARSLMKNPPAILTISNPHPAAYFIIKSGTADGRDYVDAEETLVYNADGYYAVDRTRFYLSRGGEGYRIDHTAPLSGGFEVCVRDGSIYLSHKPDGKQQLLFKPAGISGESPMRLSSLAYDPDKQLLVYSIQGSDSFIAIAQDLKKGKEVFRKEFRGKDAMVLDIVFNESADQAAIRWYSNSIQHLVLYDAARNRLINSSELDGVTSAFWAGDKMLIDRQSSGITIRTQL